MTRTDHAVIIAGGGPTGLMLAGELALAGIDVAIVERRASQELEGSRAGGLHARTLEELDQRGIADRFIAEGKKHPAAAFHLFPLDASELPTRHNYVLGLWQSHIERILAGWVDELRVPFYRAVEVSGFTQDDSGVDVTLSNGRSLRAEYLVGCDGGRSIVRKTAGIGFPGSDATISWLITEVEMIEEPKLGFHTDAIGTHAIGKLEGEGVPRYRMALTERAPRPTPERTLGDVQDLLLAIYGTDFGARNPTWISSFTDMTRQAAAYRDRRVLLAGDAAHVHPPMGGQGLNTGVQDAVNLGWKLAQVIKGISPDTLLDTYHAERHPVGARVLQNTMAQSALRRTDDRTKALGEIVAELFRMDEPRRRMAAEMTGLAAHYDLGAGHPLLGRRMPDLEVITEDGPRRIFTFLHNGHALLLNLGERGTLDITPWSDRVQSLDANYDGAWVLPVLGAVAAPSAVLVRPDGYVAWVGDKTASGLEDALTRWFGESPRLTPGA
jgi:3-(3-hydroxy-phenyl)propionate hydroxylase